MISKFWICLLLGILKLSADGLTQYKLQSTENKIQVVVSIGDLLIEQEAIFINIDGSWHPVQSLEKSDTQWMAKVEVDQNNLNYCPRLHPLCGHCKQCHKVGCWYYVRRCPGNN